MGPHITILPCPNCRRHLRVPADRGELVLTCPLCRTRWDWTPPQADVLFIDDEVLLITDETSQPGDPGRDPTRQGDDDDERERGPTPGEDPAAGDLWDEGLDGPRRRERPGTTILPCPGCPQLLRVPTDRGELVLTCPLCRTRWDWSPSHGCDPRQGGWGGRIRRFFQRRRT